MATLVQAKKKAVAGRTTEHQLWRGLAAPLTSDYHHRWQPDDLQEYASNAHCLDIQIGSSMTLYERADVREAKGRGSIFTLSLPYKAFFTLSMMMEHIKNSAVGMVAEEDISWTRSRVLAVNVIRWLYWIHPVVWTVLCYLRRVSSCFFLKGHPMCSVLH